MVTLDQFLTGGLPLVMDFQKCWFDRKYPRPVKLFVVVLFFKELLSVLYSL